MTVTCRFHSTCMQSNGNMHVACSTCPLGLLLYLSSNLVKIVNLAVTAALQFEEGTRQREIREHQRIRTPTHAAIKETFIKYGIH